MFIIFQLDSIQGFVNQMISYSFGYYRDKTSTL